MHETRLMAETTNMLCDLYLTSSFVSLCGLQSAISANECKDSGMQHWYSLQKFKQPDMLPAYVNQLAFTLSDPFQQINGATGCSPKPERSLAYRL